MENIDILVIGNGFDLWCKLDSRYTDFARSRRNNNQQFYTSLNSFLEKIKPGSHIQLTHRFLLQNVPQVLNNYNSQLNFWEIYFEISNFRKNGDILWQNIEKDMLEFFKPNISTNVSFRELFRIIVSNTDLESMLSTVISRETILNYFLYFVMIKQKELQYPSQTDDVKDSLNFFGSCGNKQGLDNFGRYLLNELNRFEKLFGLFLREQMKLNQKYNESASNLVALITKDLGNASLGNENNKVYYLNFNYTLPIVKQLSRNGTNVHGYTGDDADNNCGEIIIGIDQEEIDVNGSEYVFTKTYRKLFLKQDLISQPLPSKKLVKRIIFFGHSYGKADYSYFRSVFDYYDIESSDVQLIFYYSVYNENLRDEISHNQYKSVSSLLVDYSKNANTHAGKNLLHRLLLEHRLTIQEV